MAKGGILYKKNLIRRVNKRQNRTGKKVRKSIIKIIEG